VRGVGAGAKTFEGRINEALRDWVTNVIRLIICPQRAQVHNPYPLMVRDFQSVIGRDSQAAI
jgi:tryptophan synthase beta chain